MHVDLQRHCVNCVRASNYSDSYSVASSTQHVTHSYVPRSKLYLLVIAHMQNTAHCRCVVLI